MNKGKRNGHDQFIPYVASIDQTFTFFARLKCPIIKFGVQIDIPPPEFTSSLIMNVITHMPPPVYALYCIHCINTFLEKMGSLTAHT